MEVASNGVPATVTVSPTNNLCDVIVLVDASASLSGVFQGLMNDYILPCLEYFSGGSMKHSSSELQYGPVQFGMVTMNSPGLTYRQACTYYPVTCDAARVHQWLKEMRFEGGLMEHSVRLSEGFAAVLELCDLMSTTRERCLGPEQTVEKYCLLVCNFLPSSHSCVESMTYGGKTHEQLSKIMVERNLKVSVISPRNLVHFKTIFERGLLSSDADTKDIISDCQHALHVGHTVLFQGFTLQSLKKRREEALSKKVKENESKQMPLKVETRMDTQTTGTATNGVAQNPDKSGQLLSTSYDSKTPPNQSSPIGGTRNPSPSYPKATPSSVADENPTSVPPPSVFAAPSPSNVASPQRQPIPSTLTSVSPPSNPTAAPITRVPSSTQLHTTRASFSGPIPMQAAASPSSVAQQVVPQLQVPNRSLAQAGTQQIGVTSIASSQPSHMGNIPTQQSLPNPLGQGAPNVSPSLNRAPPSSTSMTALSLPSSMSSGFPNVVATCTSLPSTSTSPIFSHLGAPSSLGNQSLPSQRQPVGSMAAAVAAAESAVMQANAQVLPSRLGMSSGISIPGQTGGIGQGMTNTVMASQPNMNIGLTSLVGSSQSLTTATPAMISSTQSPQQSVTGTQPNSSAMQPSIQGQQPRPLGSVPPGTQPPGASTGQPTVQSQFGAQAPGHVMGPGTAQSQGQTGMPQNIGRGQQPLGGPQASLPNSGMVPTQPGHMQPQSLQPGMVGASQAASSNMPNTIQQPPHSGSQPVMSTGMQAPGQQVHPGQPGAFGGQPQQQLQQTIWNGTVDIMEPQQRGQRPVKRPIQCSISAKREYIPELHPESWPQHLTMQAYPKQATSMIMSLMKLNQQQNMVRVVTFNFAESPEQVYTLRLLMSNDQTQKHFGIVHFNSVTPQPIKALILVWNEKAMQFTGLIPIEQEKFVEVLKQVFNRRQPQQGQPMGMSGPQLMGNQQVPQQSGVSSLPGQQQMMMGGTQPNQPGTSSDPSMLTSMSMNAPMSMVGMQPQPAQQQLAQSRQERNKQLEKIIMLLERSSPEQQQQIFQKMPQLTPESQQSLLQRVHALRVQKQQLQRQQQQQQLHAMNQQQQQQQQQQQSGMMGGQMPDVMGQLGMSGGLGQQSQQQQQQPQSSQMTRQPQQQGIPQGGMGMQVGMQRTSMQTQQQQQQQHPPGMDPNTFQWQSQ